MALVLPIFIVLLLMAIDFGRVFFTYIQITNAAREAAAYGASIPTDDVGITTRANAEKNVQSQGGEGASSVTLTCADSAGNEIDCADSMSGGGPGNTLTVTLEEPFTFLTPLVTSIVGDITLDATATSTVLGYAAGGSGTPPAACNPPVASFTVTVTADLTVRVDPSASTPNSGVCNISGYLWTWGDLSEDTVGSATGDDHTYASAGTYTIELEVTNQGGSAFADEDVTVPVGTPVVCDPPVANFTITENGRIHTYRDTSTVTDPDECAISNWLWTFPNGTGSDVQNPAPVTYGNNGNHDVTLRVTNLGGTHSITKRH